MQQIKRRPIFKQGFAPFWSFFPMGLLVAIGGGWIQASNTGSLSQGILYGLPIAAGITALAVVLSYYKTRKTVAVLFLDGETLTGRRQTLLWAGAPFSFSTDETTGWRWYDSHNRRNNVTVVLEFRHDRQVYRLPLYGARIVHLAALRALAPTVVDDAITSSGNFLKHKGPR